MSEIKEYKCPACGGAMEFDSKSQKMKCPYCDTEISVDEYESLIAKADQVVAADAASDVETEQKKSENYTAHDWNQDEIDNMVVYICQSCGGEITTDKNTGGIRDVIIMKNFDLLSVIGGLFVVMLIFNIATGKFVVGFNTPGVIAHSEHLWNILGMYTVGFAAVLAGGCPLRQLILAGQGSSDSGVTVIGMFVGAAICHNFGLAASGTALNPETKAVVAGAVPTNGKVACILCIVVLFIIAFTCKRETAKK